MRHDFYITRKINSKNKYLLRYFISLWRIKWAQTRNNIFHSKESSRGRQTVSTSASDAQPPMSAPVAVAAAAENDELETPVLDAERANLLQRITEEGGYAYASMEALAAGGDVRAAEAAREMAWEQLHSGPWHSVVPIWRDAYSIACLHVARLHYAAGDLYQAIRALDMGIIMGGLALRDDLNLAMRKASRKASIALGASLPKDQPIRIVSGEFNIEEVRFVSFPLSLVDSHSFLSGNETMP